MMDLMADDLNIDPAVLRHRNLLRPEELPYRIGELVPGRMLRWTKAIIHRL